MTPDVKIADPERSVRDAGRLMAKSEAGALPVGENDRLIGMITDDIVVRVIGADKDPGATKIREAMTTSNVEYCFEDDNVASAVQHMARTKAATGCSESPEAVGRHRLDPRPPLQRARPKRQCNGGR